MAQTTPSLAKVLSEVGAFAHPIRHETLESEDDNAVDRAFYYLLSLLLQDSALEQLMSCPESTNQAPQVTSEQG